MSSIVLGHINPDTDTVCSAIAYAWYLKNHAGVEAEARMAGPLNKETAFVLDRFVLAAPQLVSELGEGQDLYLVDTNNPEELVAGYAKANLLGIVDHHKLVGGLSTASPVAVTMKPVACTATILLEMMADAEIPTDIAGIMLSAILSDTLKFTSPTTTDEDRAAADYLADLAGVQVDELAEAMFAAKSDLTGMSARDVLTVDSKVFPFGSKKARISVLETTRTESALSLLSELEADLAAMKAEEGLDAAFMFIVDIIASSAIAVVPSDTEREIVATAFGVQFSGQTAELPGIVSRKKQIVPKIEAAMA